MKKYTKDLVAQLKQNGQDFEFYPTTDEMFDVIVNDLKIKEYNRFESVLDIGAGTAHFKDRLAEVKKNFTYFAIEKSEILIQNYSSDIVVIGTDFNETTLIDKKSDVVFCNPPYTDYVNWTTRILKETDARAIYMVIPKRWKDHAQLKNVVETLRIDYKVLGTFSFENAERQARAIVDVIKFSKRCDEYRETDPFSVWFYETFKSLENEENDQYDQENIKQELVSLNNKDKVNLLVEFYQAEMENIQKAFESICSLDANTLKSIGIDKKSIKTALKDKLTNLKYKYWHELYTCLDTITDRLTSKTRYEMQQRFNAMGAIDFTEGNIRAVVLWIVKNTYKYMESQLVDLYKHFSDFENVKMYKSNQKTFTAEEWRWNKEDEVRKNYSLDYRIIADERWNNNYMWQETTINENKARTSTDDICTIAFNLGFRCTERPVIKEFGTKYYYMLDNNKPLFEVKVYKNGNAHYKFNVEFCKAFNVEAGRILGWIKNKAEAKKELDGEKYFNVMNNSQLLLAFNG